MKQIFFTSVLILLFTIACSSTDAQVATSVAATLEQENVIAEAIAATQTAAPTDTPSSTDTPIPTDTPTSTPLPTETPTPTPTATQTPTNTPVPPTPFTINEYDIALLPFGRTLPVNERDSLIDEIDAFLSEQDNCFGFRISSNTIFAAGNLLEDNGVCLLQALISSGAFVTWMFEDQFEDLQGLPNDTSRAPENDAFKITLVQFDLVNFETTLEAINNIQYSFDSPAQHFDGYNIVVNSSLLPYACFDGTDNNEGYKLCGDVDESFFWMTRGGRFGAFSTELDTTCVAIMAANVYSIFCYDTEWYSDIYGG